MAKALTNCRFAPTLGGTTDWVYSSAASGSQSPTASGAIDGATYRYAAFSADLTQWEVGYGAYTASTGTFARTTVQYNSSGTTSKINFSVAPTVGIVPTSDDFREVIAANRTYYVGASLGAPTITIATPAVVTLASHGLSANDPVVFNVPLNTNSCTVTAASPAVVSMTNTFAAGQPVVFSSTGYLPTGLTAGTTYYVISTGLSGSSFQVSATVGGAAINTTAVTATFTNGSDTITAGATDNLVVGQIVRFAGTSVVNFANATDYYVTAVPTGTTFKVSATNGGTAITAGAVTSNGTLVQAGTHFCSQTGALPTGITAGTTYYVISAGLTSNAFEVSTSVGGSAVNTSGSVTGTPLYNVYTGNDSNTGLAQTRAGAFLTIQKAVDTIAGLDINAYTVTVQLANGIFTSTTTLKNVSGFASQGNLVIQGNSTTPDNVVVSVTGGHGFYADNVPTCVWDIKDLKVTTTTSGYSFYFNAAKIRFGNIDFGAAVGAHITSVGGSSVIAMSNYKISGAGAYHWYVGSGGSTDFAALTVTIVGVPAFSPWALVGNQCYISCWGMTFTGSATGSRITWNSQSNVFTNGAATTYLPGNSYTAPSGASYSIYS